MWRWSSPKMGRKVGAARFKKYALPMAKREVGPPLQPLKNLVNLGHTLGAPMPDVVNIHEAKTHLSRLLSREVQMRGTLLPREGGI